MYEWFVNLLADLDKESATILGTGLAAVLVSVITGLRGIKKGMPDVTPTAHAIAQLSCGAPEMKSEMITMRLKHGEIIVSIDRLQADIERIAEQVTRIEDRTRYRQD